MFDWELATSSLTAFLSSGYFICAILIVVGCSVFSKLLHLLWLAGVLFLVWAACYFGVGGIILDLVRCV